MLCVVFKEKWDMSQITLKKTPLLLLKIYNFLLVCSIEIFEFELQKPIKRKLNNVTSHNYSKNSDSCMGGNVINKAF